MEVGKLEQHIDGCGISRDTKLADILFYYIVLSLTQVTMQLIFLLLLLPPFLRGFIFFHNVLFCLCACNL
jgi:hypothetical protein